MPIEPRPPCWTLVLCVLLTGCGSFVAPSPVPVPPVTAERSELPLSVALMLQAQSASGEEWMRLNQVLERAAVMNPQPHLRARVALAASQGGRTHEELTHAVRLMDELLDGVLPERSGQVTQPMDEDLRDLLRLQRAQLARRLEAMAELARLEQELTRVRAQIRREASLHAKVRRERDGVQGELEDARQQLRAVTRIELKHESSGG